jgi:hypothetical protein
MEPGEAPAPIHILKTDKPLAEVAEALKARLEGKLKEIAIIMDEANAAGLVVDFTMGAQSYNGKNAIAKLNLVKIY